MHTISFFKISNSQTNRVLIKNAKSVLRYYITKNIVTTFLSPVHTICFILRKSSASKYKVFWSIRSQRANQRKSNLQILLYILQTHSSIDLYVKVSFAGNEKTSTESIATHYKRTGIKIKDFENEDSETWSFENKPTNGKGKGRS